MLKKDLEELANKQAKEIVKLEKKVKQLESGHSTLKVVNAKLLETKFELESELLPYKAEEDECRSLMGIIRVFFRKITNLYK